MCKRINSMLNLFPPLKVTVAKMEQLTVYGIWENSNDKTVAEDIKKLSER